ncbi:MAG: hypothetical protein ACTSRS_11110 [Candidatus Helarchaeota archaeon]
MREKSYILIGLIFCFTILLYLNQASYFNFDGDFESDYKNLGIKDESSPPPYERVLLNRFPISLDILFKLDLPAQRNAQLDNIRNRDMNWGELFLVPYPFLFHLTHAPGAAKWYLYVGRHTPVSFSIDSYMEIEQDWGNNSTKIINGTEVQVNLRVNFYVNYYITFNLDHVCINKSLVDAYFMAPEIDVFGVQRQAIFIPANTTFGFSDESTALDFLVLDTHEPNWPLIREKGSFGDYVANPFLYFTESAQNEILSYYQAQYDAMKESGGYVESTLNRTYNINEEGTLFGIWYYHEGPFHLKPFHHTDSWYLFEGATLDILNVNASDRETFYKDKNTGANFTNDMIGIFGDALYSDVDNYEFIGGRYMYLVKGNLSQGIVNLTKFTYLEGRSGPLYMKYLLEPSNVTMYDDLLHVEYFNSTIEAQGPFTSNKITYIRLYEYHPEPSINSPPDMCYAANSTIFLSQWVIRDNDPGGFYSVLLNDTVYIDWTPWTNGSNLIIPIETNQGCGTWNYTIIYNDTDGMWGWPDTVLITIDGVAPISNSPQDATYEAYSPDNFILWSLSDDVSGGYYCVLLNGVLYINWASWNSLEPIPILIDSTKGLGTWNYTILYNDSAGLWGTPDVVLITIYTEPETTIPSFEIFFGILGIIALLLFTIKKCVKEILKEIPLFILKLKYIQTKEK